MSARPPCSVCGLPATIRCSLCRVVFYCGEEHRSADWLTHIPQCRACKVHHCRKTGFFLKATRHIYEGEVIFTEYPFVIGPIHYCKSPCCVGCSRGLPSRQDTLPKCAQCQWVTCSQSCLGLSDPDGHAVECALLKLVVDKSCPRQLILPFRCMLLQKRKPKMWDWLLDHARGAVTRQTNKSMHHSAASELENIAKTIFQNDSTFLPLDYSDETFRKIFAVLDAYGLCFYSLRRKTDLSGLYRTAGFLQLSCIANTRTDFSDFSENGLRKGLGRVVVSAIRDIRKGEKLTYSYASPLSSTFIRQRLLARRNLVCRCPRCLHPRELGLDFGTMACPSCTGWILPVDTKNILTSDWACNRKKCGVTRSKKEIGARFMYFSKKCQEVLEPGVILRMKPETMEKMLTEFLAELHPNHELCLLLKSLMVRTYCSYNLNAGRRRIPLPLLERRAEICLQMVDAVEPLGQHIYGVEIQVVLTIKDFVDTQFEVMKRKYPSTKMDTDQATQNVIHCLTLLERALKIAKTSEIQTNFGGSGRLLDTYREVVGWAQDSGLK